MKTKYKLPKFLIFLSAVTFGFIPFLQAQAATIYYSYFTNKGVFLNYGNTDPSSQYQLVGNFGGDSYEDMLFGNLVDLNPGSPNPFYVVKFKLFLGTGTSFVAAPDVTYTLPSDQLEFLKVGNINGDSYDDLIYPLKNDQDLYSWYWLKNYGGQFRNAGLLKSNYGSSGDDFYVIDANGDSRSDVLLVSSRTNSVGDLSWYLLQSTGAELTDKNKVLDNYGKVGDKILIGDFTGDRYEDILLVTPRLTGDNSLTYLLIQSNGSTFTKKGAMLNYYGSSEDDVIVGDFNKDGKDDVSVLVARGNPNNLIDWYVATSNGSQLESKGKWKEDFGIKGTPHFVITTKPLTQTFTSRLASDILVPELLNDTTFKWSVLQPQGYSTF